MSSTKDQRQFVFNKSNYILLLVGIGLNIIGFVLMMGGAAETKEIFEEKELFSHVRITVAPILILIGYVVILYSIMKRPKKDKIKESSDN